MKTFTSIIEKREGDLTWAYHFVVPSEVVAYFQEANQKRLLCKLNDLIEYNCALISRGEGIYFVNVNKEVRKKLNLDLESKIEVVLTADKSEYGMPVPQEIVDLFAHDEEFYKRFHELTPGKQRNLLHLVGKPKSEEARVKKAVVIAKHLVDRNGNLDFKVLNQDFKDYNQLLRGE